MSSITGSCSESSTQMLFNMHIQELQEQRLEKQREEEQMLQEKKLEEAENSSNIMEPNKGQMLDVFV